MSTSDAGATQKVSLNPIDHFKAGAGPFVKTNLVAAVIAIIASAVASTALMAVFVVTIFAGGMGLLFSPGLSGNEGMAKGLLLFILAALIAAVVVGFFSSVVNRLVVTGSRGQKENFGSAFNFVVKRLSKIVLTYLLIFGIFLAGILIISLTGAVAPILGILLSIAGIVAAIIFALRISYVPLVLVDNNDPGNPMDVLKRSAALWNRSQWALVLYVLAWLAVYIVISLFTENADQYTLGTGSLFTSAYPALGFAIGSALVSSLLSNVFGALLYAGEASIYDDAGKLVGGHTSAAPQPPK
jgi:hypothetical protein